MNVRQLIHILKDFDDNAEVRLMVQENWPFEHSISHVISAQEIEGREREDPEYESMTFEGKTNHKNRIFLVEGRQLCYGNKNAWR